MGLGAAVAVWAAVGAGAVTPAVAALGTVATLGTGVGVVARWRWSVGAAVAGIVGVGAIGVVQRPSSAALFVAAACFAHAELAFAALDDAAVGAGDPGVTGQRLWLAAVVVVAGLVVGAVVLGAAYGLEGSGLGLGLALEAAGAAAMAGVAGLVVALARRPRSLSSPRRR